MMGSSKEDVVLNIVELRSAMLDAISLSCLEKRLDRFFSGLLCWTKFPAEARRFYSQLVLDTAMEIAAEIEDCTSLDPVFRQAAELSIWEGICELNIDECDPRSSRYIVSRRSRLELSLAMSSMSPITQLMYAWNRLLQPRSIPVHRLPGPYNRDIARVVGALADAGLPRRARLLALKFQYALPPLIGWAIEHRPENEECSRTTSLLHKLSTPAQPIPYGVYVTNRALLKVLSAPLMRVPLNVSNSGYIHIDSVVFGGVATSPTTQKNPVRI